MLIWYLEFAIVLPSEGPQAPVYIEDGSRRYSRKKEEPRVLESLWKRLLWASALMVPSHRGIGWNWQVKNIPKDPYKHLRKWKYVQSHLQKAVLAYMSSLAMLILMGYCSALESQLSSSSKPTLAMMNILIGWSGAIWIWARVTCFYSLLASASVAMGICETWQWPPLMGEIRDAWSVTRVWSVVYHQTMRKVNESQVIFDVA